MVTSFTMRWFVVRFQLMIVLGIAFEELNSLLSSMQTSKEVIQRLWSQVVDIEDETKFLEKVLCQQRFQHSKTLSELEDVTASLEATANAVEGIRLQFHNRDNNALVSVLPPVPRQKMASSTILTSVAFRSSTPRCESSVHIEIEPDHPQEETALAQLQKRSRVG